MKRQLIFVYLTILVCAFSCNSDHTTNQSKEATPTKKFKLNWKFTANKKINGSISNYGKNIVFKAENILYSLDTASGKESWKYDAKNSIYHCLLFDNYACCTTKDSSFILVDLKNGKEIWKYQLPFMCHSNAIIMDSKNICLGLSNGHLLCINVKNHTIKLIGKVEGIIYCLLNTSDKYLCVQTLDKMFVIEKRSNLMHWVYDANPEGIGMGDIIGSDSFVCLERAGRDRALIVEINIQSRKIIWENLTPQLNYGACMDTEIVFYTNGGKSLIAVDKMKGNILFVSQINGKCYFQPLISGNSLFFGTTNSTFTRKNKKTGKDELSFRTDGDILTPTLILGNNIYFGTENNTLYSLYNEK